MSEFGYEKERFTNYMGDQFDCPICQLVARQPKECTLCGAIFCTNCVDAWLKRKSECINRCDASKSEIRPISTALRRIYNALLIKCQYFDLCQKVVSMAEFEQHERNCQKPKCKNFDVCGNNVSERFTAEQACDVPCILLARLRAKQNDPGAQLDEIKKFLSEQGLNNQYSGTKPIAHGIDQLQQQQQQQQQPVGSVSISVAPVRVAGQHYFRWSTKNKGSSIELSNNNLNVWLKETAYMFRTIIGDTPFVSGVYYWEIHADERTENELKIGISTKEEFNYNSAFCDYEHGFSFYGLGQLRHNSNASGPQYGKRFKKEGVLGVCLNMNKGQMSFSLNGEFLGIAYQSEALKRGPIFAAVSLLHCAGCKLDSSKPVPSIFPL